MKTAISSFLFLFVLILGNTTPLQGKERIIFFGDSLTAGYGLAPEEAYPFLISEKLHEEGLEFEVINAGVSGDTTAGGLRRINWLLRAPIDIFVLALGANDGLRGQDVPAMERNLREIIDKVKEQNPDVSIIVAGMQLPLSMGNDYRNAFSEVFPRLAEDYEAAYIPFLLHRVALVENLNLSDGMHPNVEGQKILAETVWEYLKPVLDTRLQ